MPLHFRNGPLQRQDKTQNLYEAGNNTGFCNRLQAFFEVKWLDLSCPIKRKNNEHPESLFSIPNFYQENCMFLIKRVSLLSFAVFTALASCKERGRVIETIGKDTITTDKFETYYSTYIEKASRLANADKETLYKLMCNPDQIPPDPAIRELIGGLIPENNYEKFRDMKIIEQAALSEGYQDRPVIKEILDQVYMETLVNLYVQEKIQEKIKISETEKEEKCSALRKERPQQMAGLTLDQCLKVAERFIKMEIVQREYPKIIEGIKESVQIKRNPDFDREKFLKNEMVLYNEIRKTGGCANESSPAQTPASSESGK